MDAWQIARFDHDQTGFPLVGAHARLECQVCHVGGAVKGLSTGCFSCHVSDFLRAKDPDHASAGFSHDCSSCHSLAAWTGAKFDHAQNTRFPLVGVHATTSCAQCHAGGRFAGTPMQCSGCHMADFERTTNPNHQRGNFSLACENCHTSTSWQGAKFDHSLSSFQLVGAHQSVACAQCHVGGRFTGTPSTCIGCHSQDFQTATPNHVAAGFPQDCTMCHSMTQWKGGVFDHTARTKFPLTGAHATVACAQCHVGNQFAGTSADCIGCHLRDFQTANDPAHVAAGFPQDCALCHTTLQWRGAHFDHNTQTHFTLTGAHVNASCSQCHVGGRFSGTAQNCSGCHLAEFQKTTNPNHAAAGFSQDCTLCHTTAQWSGAQFDHAKTRFPLTGAHGGVACQQCHVNSVFSGTPMQCSGCHLADFQKASNPNHVKSGFPQDCTLCHSTAQWTGAVFDHSKTQFPLTGAHATVSCAQCHTGGRFAGLPMTCAGCHLADFQKTTNPNHVAAGFPQDCAACHVTNQWTGARFDHAKTQFPLTGAHAAVACSQCHVNGQFSGTSTQCSGCHIVDFQRTTDPNHAAAGFPQDCALCHTTMQWNGATFDHNSRTKFPLTGAHIQLACAQCHVGGKFAGTPADCAGCHLSDFQKTTNPNHVAAGFPQDCAVCHVTAQWQGAKFDHAQTKFPLTGAHVNVQCAQCHVGGKFAGTPVDCAGCHMADFQKTTNPNHVAAGFPQNCALCHVTAQWQGAKFDHAQTKFPLTGAHMNVQCAQCHVGGKFAGTPAECSGMPPGGFSKDDESEPCGRRIPAGLHVVSHDRHLDGR